MKIHTAAEYEASQKASRKLMYQMRKGFTIEQFDALDEIVDAQERFRLQLSDNVVTYPYGAIFNEKTGKVMKREDARPEPQPEPSQKTPWTPARHALADIRKGCPGSVCTSKIKAFIVSKDEAEKDGLALWMQAYNAELDQQGYEYGARFNSRTAKVVTRLVPKRRAV